MASSPAPTTPDNAPRRTLMNRSVTAPIRTSPATAKPPEIGATEGVETLYTHPNASIVKFTTAGSRPSSSSAGRQHGAQQALLPWSNTSERTVAAGPLQVYRVPGSVSFLNSGSLLHAILPRSQCWCVDGVSKFALRVLPETYYRIEMPGESEEDKQEVEKLKLTLQKVCFYERTPCPFDRGFDVDIEDEADLDVRKKRRRSHGPAKKWKLDRAHSWKPEGWQPSEQAESADEASGVESSAGSDDDSTSVSGREDTGEGVQLAGKVRDVKVTTPSRVRTAKQLLEQRSVTAPASQLTLQSPSSSRLRTRVDVDGTVEVARPAARKDASERQTSRTRTFQAIPTDMPPSPPDSSAGLDHGEARRETSVEPSNAHVVEAPRTEYSNRAPQEEESAEVGAEEGEHSVIVHSMHDEHNPSVLDGKTEEGGKSLNLPQAAPRPPRPAEKAAYHQIEQDSELKPLEEPTAKATSPTTSSLLPNRRRSDPFTEPLATTASRESASPSKSCAKSHPSPDDPFAAIQARILARRSIGGTTSFHPPPTRQSTSSSSSNASSSMSRRSNSSSQQQQAFATAMVKRACSVFLGPPAHLVAIMLRIAARFAKGAFGVESMFYVESPAGSRGRVPGSYHVLENGDIQGLRLETEEDDELEEWEDDFGVPLRGPVRLASMSSLRSGSGEGLRERGGRGWDVD